MEKVFVSGGSGYIALHCIAGLIKKGYAVKTSIRTLNRKKEIIDSISKVIDCDDKLEFCQLDLLKDDGWDDALKGCRYVMHTASPVSLLLSDNPDDLIKPAVNGLERCLKSAVKNNVANVSSLAPPIKQDLSSLIDIVIDMKPLLYMLFTSTLLLGVSLVPLPLVPLDAIYCSSR